jgi:hypothetical protein
MRRPQRPPTPTTCPTSPAPSESSQSIDGRGAKSHQLGQTRGDSSIAVLMKLGSGCQNCSARWAGVEMGAVAVCSARSGCLKRGVVHGDGKGSAGHAGVGLRWQTGKLTFTHGPAALISYSSTSSMKSRVLIEVRGAGPCRHRPVSLKPANEAAPGGWTAAGTTRTSIGSQK